MTQAEDHSTLRDYSATNRMLVISGLAAILGGAGAVLAWMLLGLIRLATNVFYFHQFSFANTSPADNTLGWKAVFAPVIGGLLIGVIARFGSEKIRGHGMPEAIEAIVFKGGKVAPRIAVLKPIATAIAIGSGGPFGAEGPIIMTGGATGSLIGQLLHTTDAERTTLLVAGAAAGMSATFSCPLSAVLLAVELLLFEWRPRSMVPVAVASVTAGAIRRLLLGPGPIFPMQPTIVPMHHMAMIGALIVGLAAALLSTGLSRVLYGVEDLFERLPVHWMWWPAIGGVVVGIGGLIFPPALGVGYGVIQRLVTDDITWKLIIGVLLVKSFIWTFSLGSNTSGGILAPLLMIGGAMGAALGHVLTPVSQGAWAVVGMSSVLAAAIGAPLTAAMLAVELTHNGGLMLPVLLACVVSYAMGVLLQPRSILTERLSRRGFHLSREYGVDPLETVMVRDAMHTSVFALSADATRQDAADWLAKMNQRGSEAWSHWQRLFPLVDAAGNLSGVLARSQMITAAEAGELHRPLLDSGSSKPAVIGPRETLRSAAERMAESKLTSFPVVDTNGALVGILNIDDLLTARGKASLRDSDRKRVLTLRWPFGRRQRAVHAIDDIVDRAFESAARDHIELEQAEEKIESGLD
ncbi:H+/Cl- antiporter ClcA [Edaphobacter aggregans]|uniref:H+/Cl-antiporter ClcA n=1 Tax=Edaphobacter aggregans TaxID=570835 RepID=A0A3R9QE28_9BACT|nr:chloride channel protein [Edaphobacter aggregans]RSL19403.1 H+/Cl- antiporter ClcA [Edaphobacter aggregans]